MSAQKIANQRLINEAWKHLNRTQTKSVNGMNGCCYTGSGCAFSPAIKPEVLARMAMSDNDLLNQIGSSWYKKEPKALHAWARPACSSVANRVQACHDQVDAPSGEEFLKGFKGRLGSLCEEEGYTKPWENVDEVN